MVGLLISLMVLLAAPHALAGQYQFTKIAGSTGTDFYFFSGSMNDAGSVAFIGVDGDLYRFDGSGPATPLGAVSILGQAFTRINGPGVIVYGPTASGLVRRDGNGSTEPFFAAGGAIDSLNDYSDLNDAGQLAIRVDFSNGDDGVIVTSGGPAYTTVYSEPEADIFVSRPALNASGVAAFRVVELETAIDTIYRGDGLSLEVVADANTPPFDCGDEIAGCLGTRLDIDANGAVLFNGAYGNVNQDEGYFRKDATLATIVDTTPGGFYYLRGQILGNDSGGVVFQGAETEASVFEFGLYDGPDPASDRVIVQGDALFGSTVTANGQGIRLFDFNAAGQVLFAATLATGETVLARANPLPEPGHALGALAAGLTVVAIRRGRNPRAS